MALLGKTLIEKITKRHHFNKHQIEEFKIRIKDKYPNDLEDLPEYLVAAYKRCLEIKKSFEENGKFASASEMNLDSLLLLSTTLTTIFQKFEDFNAKSLTVENYFDSIVNPKLSGSVNSETENGFKEDLGVVISSYNDLVSSYLFFEHKFINEIPKIPIIEKEIKDKSQEYVKKLEDKTEEQKKSITDYASNEKQSIVTTGKEKYDEIKKLKESASEDYKNYFTRLKLEIFNERCLDEKQQVFWTLVVIGIVSVVATIALISNINHSISNAEYVVATAINKFKIKEFVYLYVVKHSIPSIGLTLILSFIVITLVRLFRSYLNIYNSYNHKSFLLASIKALVEDKSFRDNERAMMINQIMDKLSEFDSSNVVPDSKTSEHDILNKFTNIVSSISGVKGTNS